MAILNKLSLPDLVGSLGNVIEPVLPGATSHHTVIGDVVGSSGVVDDTVDGANDGSVPGSVPNDYADAVGPGAAVQNIFNGGSIGIEGALAEHVPMIDDLPGVSQVTTTIDPATTTLGDLNSSLVMTSEGLSPGSSSPAVLTGNIIGQSGIIPDIVDNLHDGSPAGLTLSVYKDVLGVGGIVNNLGDGFGTGLEPVVHQVNGTEGTLPVVDQVPATLGSTPDTAVDVVDGVSPGASAPDTLTGNVIGNQGIADDILGGLSHGSVSEGAVGAYDDIFARGGMLNNLGDGHGAGIESLVNNASGTVGDASPLDHVAALIGGDSSMSADPIANIGDLGSLLGDHDLGGALDGLHLLGHGA